MGISPRIPAALAFLALVPASIYAVGTDRIGDIGVTLGFVCILLIAGSVVLMFGPGPGDEEGVTH